MTENSTFDTTIPNHLLLPEATQRVLELSMGNVVLQSIYVVTKLGIADLLKDGVMHSDDLAAATKTNAGILYRILRFLTRFEIVEETQPKHFVLMPMGETLQDKEGSLRKLILFRGEESYAAWGNFIHTLHTEETAFESTYGMNRCDYLERNPTREALFNEGMNIGAAIYTPALVAAFDFSTIKTLVDVGKGDRNYLLEILKHYPTVNGIFLEKPYLLESVQRQFAEAGLAERCDVISGHYLDGVPAGADGYLIGNIQRMDDDEATLLIQHCRQVIAPDGRLFIIERFISDKLPWVVLGDDLGLTVQTRGRLRTLDEFTTLLSAGGFALTQVATVDATRGVLVAAPL